MGGCCHYHSFPQVLINVPLKHWLVAILDFAYCPRDSDQCGLGPHQRHLPRAPHTFVFGTESNSSRVFVANYVTCLESQSWNRHNYESQKPYISADKSTPNLSKLCDEMWWVLRKPATATCMRRPAQKLCFQLFKERKFRYTIRLYGI